MDGFIEIADGIFYEEATGLPWSSRRDGRAKNDAPLRRIKCQEKGGYYRLGINGKREYWHRLVFEYFNGEIPERKIIDHRDGDAENNRIENLQVTTIAHNSRKMKKQKNKSGFRGVSFDKRAGKWQARISINNKQKHLGLFDDPKEAALKVDEFLKETRPEQDWPLILNFPDDI